MPLLTPGLWAFIAMAVAVPIAIVAAGRWRWHVRTRALTARLAATREPPRPARVDARALDGLPPVVQRYFRAALPEGARIIDTVSLAHAGRFDTGGHLLVGHGQAVHAAILRLVQTSGPP